MLIHGRAAIWPKPIGEWIRPGTGSRPPPPPLKCDVVYAVPKNELVVTVQVLEAKNTWSYGVTQG
jgi:hypothetical protein